LPEQLRHHAQAGDSDSGDEQSGGLTNAPLWHRLAEQRVGVGPMQRFMGWVILALALGLGAFQLYIGITFDLDAREQRLIHLMLVLTLIFLTIPAVKSRWGRSIPMLMVDLGLVVAAIITSIYPIANAAELAQRAGAYETTDWALGLVITVLLLEATRRTVG